jgi:hypothetical protein
MEPMASKEKNCPRNTHLAHIYGETLVPFRLIDVSRQTRGLKKFQ